MSIEEFNKWCDDNIEKEIVLLRRQYPKCRKSIRDDISDFYIHVAEKVIDELICPKKYLYQYVYNRHHRFFAGQRNNDFLLNLKNLKIELVKDLVDDREDIEYNEDQYADVDRVSEIIKTLPLYDQKLFQYYYVEGQTIKEIAEYIGISHNGIHKHIVKLRNAVKIRMEGKV